MRKIIHKKYSKTKFITAITLKYVNPTIKFDYLRYAPPQIKKKIIINDEDTQFSPMKILCSPNEHIFQLCITFA